jgi:spermidine synthase
VPQLGLVRTGLFFGLLNAAVAVWALWLFRHELRHGRAHAAACAGVIAALLAGMASADHITSWAEDKLYQDRVVFASTSAYQRIVVTHAPGEGRVGYRLFLNGNLQFAQRDEYRYHEALVHPAMAAFAPNAQGAKRVLVLGGGDGMAVRELLKYPALEHVTLVDLDPAMTRMFTQQQALALLNGHALSDPRVQVVNADAFAWLEQSAEVFDLVVVDFPDPTNFAIGKLYTQSFYALLDKHLGASGYAVVQTTSPLVARQSFWTVVQTIEAAGLHTAPYHANVPSFGEWGFVIASRRPWAPPQRLPAGLKFMNAPTLPTLFNFPPDMARLPAEVNRLSNQVLVQTYEQEWGRVAVVH